MSEEPFLTEWMDLEHYPGPYENDSLIETITFLAQQFGKAFSEVQATFDKLLETQLTVYQQIVSATESFLVSSRHSLPMQVDVDKPSWCNRRNMHGPYEGSGFDRRGRKKY